MRTTLLALAALTAFAFADAPNTLTDAEKAAGWKLLFDGKTTAGWRAIGKDEFPAKGWLVEDGVLKHVSKGGGGDIVTSEDYESFELTWEWKIAEAGNSGVKYNFPDRDKNIGCEYQLVDDEKHPDGVRGGKSHQTAALYDLIEPTDRKTKPVGEWNSSRLIVHGNHVEHWLNDVKTVEFELGSEDIKARIAKSKYKKVTGFGEKKKGPILLQDHGDEVSFRSIKLRALKQRALRSMLEDNLRDWLAADLADLARTHIPFGKYGPEHYPPRGVVLYDLPLEYLAWFARKECFPQGRLGELLRIAHQLKADGCDEVFDQFRKARGGRTRLRPERKPLRETFPD